MIQTLSQTMSAFRGEADIGFVRCTCLLLTQSGHQRPSVSLASCARLQFAAKLRGKPKDAGAA